MKEEIFSRTEVWEKKPKLDEKEHSSGGVNSPIKVKNIMTVTYGPESNSEGTISMSMKGPILGKEVREK